MFREIPEFYIHISEPAIQKLWLEPYFLKPDFKAKPSPNSNDSLCHVIDSCKIFGSTLGVRLNENKTDLDWF